MQISIDQDADVRYNPPTKTAVTRNNQQNKQQASIVILYSAITLDTWVHT